MIKRRAPLLLSLTFFLSSLALLHQVNQHFATPSYRPAPISVVAVAPAREVLQVEGVWEQYAIHEDGSRYFMARLDIDANGFDYLATPTETAEDVFPKHTYRSYDHRYENGVWTFREAWDDGEVGEFVLERQENGEYVGSAYLAGCSQERFPTVFVKISD